MIKTCSYIDHTLLKPVALYGDIRQLCLEAMEYGFAAVCVPPNLLPVCSEVLGQNTVKKATVIGFPFGYSATAAKMAEVEQAIQDGADELDVVINLVDLKNQEWKKLEVEMREITETIHKEKKLVKVIIESGILSKEEIVHCCGLYGSLQVDFLKTSTGYAEKGATIEAVELMRKHLPGNVRIKASGGIRTYRFALELMEAGADRLGCSSSVQIMKEEMNAH